MRRVEIPQCSGLLPRCVLLFGSRTGEAAAPVSIQNDSGLAQGPAPWSNAACGAARLPAKGKPYMRRRDFIALLGGAVAAPLHLTLAQTSSGKRLLGALFSQSESDREGQARVAALRQGLHELGWVEGQNVHIDYRWAGGSIERMRPLAAELVSLKPEVIF